MAPLKQSSQQSAGASIMVSRAVSNPGAALTVSSSLANLHAIKTVPSASHGGAAAVVNGDSQLALDLDPLQPGELQLSVTPRLGAGMQQPRGLAHGAASHGELRLAGRRLWVLGGGMVVVVVGAKHQVCPAPVQFSGNFSQQSCAWHCTRKRCCCSASAA